jgi:phosphoribosylglycinamide formyltransferase 1
MQSIIIFASGRGSNAEAIIQYFKKTGTAKVSLIVCNNPNAGVINIAEQYDIPFLLVDKQTFKERLFVVQIQEYKPSLIVLAGFLWKIPDILITAFSGKIINIHPSLLPKYGGKGMYGHHVHDAVITSGEKESGITIHYVNEHYDEGNHILQAHCSIHEGDNAETLAKRIGLLEHAFFAKTIEYLLTNNN